MRIISTLIARGHDVADYIFVLDTPRRNVSVVRLAKPHSKEAFGEGLPRKGVCGSDHISLAADLHWPSR